MSKVDERSRSQLLVSCRFQEMTAPFFPMFKVPYIGKMRLNFLQSSYNDSYVILNHRNYEHENHLG